jgi:DNA-binding CsgD family transcriptional regulator
MTGRRHIELTPRELTVVTLVVDGRSSAEIAATLEIAVRTVQAHLASAMEKTGTHTRTQLAVYALRRGLVPFEPPDEEPSR